ncbi:hypothetical protein M513_09252 [Trichuris suis]|uniref:ISXO2-like transposase domain-containing protein n=1 Tax=Trichuris suis TaxID=68888 RepID=A0A085LXT9_9BILA|nr:hypothetical protein M513_09252 [Trichuris suis]
MHTNDIQSTYIIVVLQNERILGKRFATTACKAHFSLFQQLTMFGRTSTNSSVMNELIPDERSAIALLQAKGILHQQGHCDCGEGMSLSLKGRPARWRCRRPRCGKQVSLRAGTWLEGTRLEFSKVVRFVHAWRHKYGTTELCKNMLGMTPQAVTKWKSRIREIVALSLLRSPLRIGGPGFIVEIDESLFSRTKDHHGRSYPQQWVLGGVCRETGQWLLVPVEDRTRDTLLPIIRDHVRLGTTIMTDRWRAYNSLSRVGYTDLQVNHSENFVDPETGATHKGLNGCGHN